MSVWRWPVGSNIASERVRKGLTQEQLSEEIGISKAAVKAWELGKRKPNGDALLRLSSLFGCSSDYLLGLTEERLPR